MIKPMRPALCRERPTYGKRRRPIFTPRIEARRKIAAIVWGGPSTVGYRIMMLRHFWRPRK